MANDTEKTATGPDLSLGVSIAGFADGQMLAGHVEGEEVLLIRRGDEFCAIGAHCTHYHAPLVDGLVVGHEIRCPWHHARFDLRTGEAIRAPAIAPLACWDLSREGEKVYVRRKRVASRIKQRTFTSGKPDRIIIVGGGAAGFAAAEMLRRQAHQGSIVMLSDDEAPPVDRPNLSKDYLAGTAPEEWIPLRSDGFYAEHKIDLRLATKVERIDVKRQEVILTDGSVLDYDRLLLATGAEPNRLSIPGADQPHVHTLRSLADCRAIIEHAQTARTAVVLGASFIGLEVAAALRTRGIDVHLVAPESRPMERLLGPQLSDFVHALHVQHGVVFHLEEVASAIEGRCVRLKGGGTLTADLVVAGIGVRPRTVLAEHSGLAVDRGVSVNAFLETSAPGVFAAGDIARWPDPHSGEAIRVEHWVVAQRQGQTAALNMLGHRQAFEDVPFFWSQHYDVQINYLGHAERWDELTIEGDVASRDCLVRYKRRGRELAVASISRDMANLQEEVAMETALLSSRS